MPDSDVTANAAIVVCPLIILTGGTPTASRNLVLPTIYGATYVVFNDMGVAQSIVAKTASGSGVTVGQGVARFVFCDGTNYKNTS
jgi:hypothetical protein